MFTIIPIMKSSVTNISPTVTTTGESSVTSTSATLGGNVTDDGGATVTERGIVYSVTSSNATPTIGGFAVTKDTNGSGTGVFSESILSLTVNTGYSFRAYAINSEGTSYGSVDTFTTLGPSTTAFDMTQDLYATSGAACSSGGTGDTGTYYHDGSGSYPTVNDTVYTNSGGTTVFDGSDLWYYVDGNSTAVKINSSGVVTSSAIC